MREGAGLRVWSVAVIVCVQPDPGPEFVRLRIRDAVRTGGCVRVRACACLLPSDCRVGSLCVGEFLWEKLMRVGIWCQAGASGLEFVSRSVAGRRLCLRLVEEG